MRKIGIIFLMVLSINIIQGQNYESIVDTNKMWVIFQSSSVTPPGYGISYAYKISDSVFSEEEWWYKVWESHDNGFNNWEEFGIIREENNQVFFSQINYSDVKLMYDFNLYIGDTMEIEENCEFEILDTTTSEFAGKFRYMQHFDIWRSSIGKHIEGIGSTYGLIAPYFYCFTGPERTLQCVYENDEIIYHNPSYDTCYIYDPYTCQAAFSYQIDSLTVSFTDESTGYYNLTFWDFGNGEWKEAENPIHTFLDTGVYVVTLRVFDSIWSCINDHSEVIPITGTGNEIIRFNSIKEKVKIYPNPVKDKLYLKTKILGLKYRIIYSDGRIIQKGELTNIVNKIDFHYNSGIYIIEISDEFDRIIEIKKLIK